MTNADPSRRRPSLLELGPTWIVAIATLIGALATAGFFAGRASVPGDHAGGQASVTSPARTASADSTSSGSPQQAAGNVLTEFTVDLPPYHGINFASTATKPFSTSGGESAHFVAQPLAFAADSTFVTPDGDPSYNDCRNSTRFTGVLEIRRGQHFCYIGHGLVVRAHVDAFSYGKYATVTFTVWQGDPT